MTYPRDPDSGLEELLRSTLHGEAETVTPGGDGLARIQQRTAARGRRLWLRPVAVVGGAAVAAAAGFTAYAVTSSHQNDRDTVTANNPPSLPPSTPPVTPTTSTTPTAPVAPVFPASAFYPFTSAAQEQSWEAQRGQIAQPWIVDPVASAKNFVKSYVLADGVDQVMGSHLGKRTATVTLGRTMTDGGSNRQVKVTTVNLQRFGKAWLVTGAVDPTALLQIASPARSAHVTSPVTVSGPGFGVDEAVSVDVAAIGTRLSASSGHVSFGGGVPTWSTTVAFAPPADARGAVIVTQGSAADSGLARIVVTGVTFDSQSSGYPSYFYAVKNNRITKYSSRDGSSLVYLTKPAVAGTTVTDPQLVGDQVYFLAGPSCANSIQSVPVTGGDPTTVATADAGYEISGFSVHVPKVNTFYETACVPGTSPAARLVINTLVNDTQQMTTKVDFGSVPPGIVADPTWDSDGQHFDAILRAGTQSRLARYDAYGSTPTNPNDNALACSGFDASSRDPLAEEIDANGYLWVATRTGSSMDVVRCIGSSSQVMFTIAGNRQPADIDVAGSGSAVLLTDTTGQVWRWNPGGNVTQLTPKLPINQLTW